MTTVSIHAEDGRRKMCKGTQMKIGLLISFAALLVRKPLVGFVV